jgi:hypothetical protein
VVGGGLAGAGVVAEAVLVGADAAAEGGLAAADVDEGEADARAGAAGGKHVTSSRVTR